MLFRSRTALKLGGTYALMTTLVFWLLPRPIVRLFIAEGIAVEIAVSYLIIIGFSQVFSAVEMITNGLFTGMGMPKISANISILFTVLRIPLALLFMNQWGIAGIWWSITASSILKGTTAYLYYRLKVKGRYNNERTMA